MVPTLMCTFFILLLPGCNAQPLGFWSRCAQSQRRSFYHYEQNQSSRDQQWRRWESNPSRLLARQPRHLGTCAPSRAPKTLGTGTASTRNQSPLFEALLGSCHRTFELDAGQTKKASVIVTPGLGVFQKS